MAILPEQSFLRWYFGTIAALLGAVGLFNLAIDPYSLFGSPRMPGVNENKPDFVDHLRLTHAYGVMRRKPNCIILGTSRTGRGLDPDHPSLVQWDCYNMALPAISVYEMRRYLQHAQSVRPLQHAILAFDFRIFHTDADRSGAFQESRLNVDPQGRPQDMLRSEVFSDGATSLLSLDAFQASLKTIRQQRWLKDTVAPNGYWRSLGDSGDSQPAFAAYTRNSIRRFAEARSDAMLFERNVEEFRRLLRMTYATTTGVVLLISPSHGWHWQTLELSGLWPRFEAMKRRMVEINAEEARIARRPPYPIWDFSGACGPALEPAPIDASSRLHWFWEPVHYRKALGDVMLDRIAGRGEAVPAWAQCWTTLEPGQIDTHLARLRELQRDYAMTHPIDVARIRSLAGKSLTQ